MNKITKKLVLLLMICALPLCAGIKESKGAMKKRLPQIVKLKSAQVIGENNQGYLTLLKGGDQALVTAENLDRKVLYAAIAKKHRISTADVARQRALIIRKKAASGTQLQDDKGKWYSK